MTEEQKQIQIINNLIMYCRGFEEKKYTDKELFTAIEYVSDLIQNLQTELEKKNKMINEMAEWIFDKDYTENSLLIHRDDYYSNCIKQVEQYFEKKAGE